MIGLLSWVTYASDNREGIKSLILAKSLRRSITRRSLTIFVSHDISLQIRQLLEDEFDRCIYLDGTDFHLCSAHISFKDLALVNCWKLKKLKKFAFLDCNCLVVKNSDDIFKQKGVGIFYNQNGEERVSILVDSPSGNTFNKLADMMKSLETDVRLKEMSAFYPKQCIDAKYSVEVNLEKAALKRNLTEINILWLACNDNNYPVVDHEKHGILEKAVFNIWSELFLSIYEDQNAPEKKLFQIQEATLNQIKSFRNPAIPPVSFNHLEDLADSVAIVGMSLRFPGANNPEEFWDLLIKGKDGIVKVPENRWNEDQSLYLNENVKETLAGFLKCPIDEIDGKFFGLSGAELSFLDPQARLTLQVMWESLEHAGMNPLELKGSKTGVFGGWWRTDYKEMIEQVGVDEQEFFRIYMGNSLGTLSARISHILELVGPCISTESGCSTSIVAVDMACKSLLNEDCDVGLAFGVNLLIHPFSNEMMNFVVAKDGHCKTFDAEADGFGRAEGCAVLVLKRFADAVRDGDGIHALIRGSAIVQEGPSKSMGTPTKQCEALAMHLALEDARVEPHQVTFLETHGTGTALGDPLEVAAITQVYSKDRDEPLVIGSVKTNVGHTESCSGIAGIIKTLLSLQNQLIPPHRNFKTLNPQINLDKIPAIIPKSPFKWQKRCDGKARIAGVSSFGITGTDGHIIIQETPEYPSQGLSVPSVQPMSILKLSAKTKEAMLDILSTYKTFLSESKDDLSSITYTANSGRGDFKYRTAITGKDKTDILEKLEKQSYEIKQVENETPKICFFFTGQGSQYTGMAKGLYESCPTFKMHFDQCQEILEKQFSISIKDVLWGKDGASHISRTIYSQTSIFCIEYCLLKVWESWGVKPDAVVGHSLGEFAAAVAANILTLEDALTLVAERSILIDSLPQGKMIVVKSNYSSVVDSLKAAFSSEHTHLDIAAINSSEQTVLAGSQKDVEAFAKFCKNNQIKTVILEATHAFHSKHMEPILEKYQKIASNIKYSDPTCLYISGMEGSVVDAGQINAEYWVRHTREPVQFFKACESAIQSGYSLYLEIGPQPILSSLFMINIDNMSIPGPTPVCLPSLRKQEEEWSTMFSTLANLYTNGVDINWQGLYQFIPKRKVVVPFYPFQNKPYWFDVKGNNRPRPIHPLVGNPIPNPSQMKLYQNYLEVNKLSYLKDHVIGKTIVFPGAGYVEMCMVAGHAASNCLDDAYVPPLTPFTLENFLIEAPLALNEKEKTEIQITVSSEDSSDPKVTIHTKLCLDKETQKWIRHASASFSPYALQFPAQEMFLNDSLEDVKARCTRVTEEPSTEYYERFDKLGLKFGKTFRTLGPSWNDPRKVEYLTELVLTYPQCTLPSYICHPVVIDAMLQATMITSDQDPNNIHVPISIEKFIWYGKSNSDKRFIHCRRVNTNSGFEKESIITTLYDGDGHRLAIMIGPTFMETSVSTIISVIEAQRTSLPNMYQEVWREMLGPLERRISKSVNFDLLFSEDFKKSLSELNQVDETGQIFYEKTNELYFLYMVKALYDLGFTSGQNVPLTLFPEEMMKELNIQPQFKGFFLYMLNELVNEGYLTISESDDDDPSFEMLKSLPSKYQICTEIEKIYSQSHPEINVEIDAYSATGKKLADILSGKQSALSILFPEDPNDPIPPEVIYNKSEVGLRDTCIMTKVISTVLQNIVSNTKSMNPVIRILEVGAGTGSLTRTFVSLLDESKIDYEYTFTDISQNFFRYGERIFSKSSSGDTGSNGKVVYKTFNVEIDPLAQGFIPHHYDIICAQWVIHATKDLRQSLGNIRSLLRPSGMLLLSELPEPLRGIRLTFGVLDGFWRFTDPDLRPVNCELSADKWKPLLHEQGFEKASVFEAYLGHTAVIVAQGYDDIDTCSLTSLTDRFKLKVQDEERTWMIFSDEPESSQFFTSRLTELGKRTVVVRRSNEFKIHLDKENTTTEIEIDSKDESHMEKVFDQIFPYSKNEPLLPEGIIFLWGMENISEDYETFVQPFLDLSKILVGLDSPVKLFIFSRGLLPIGDHEQALPFANCLLGMAKVLTNENNNLQMRCIDLEPRTAISEALCEGWAEIFIDDMENCVGYRANRRHILRLTTCKMSNTTQTVPKSPRFHLVLPPTNSISDLKFGPITEKPVLGENEIEIEVKAFSLNFRDLFVVLKPSVEFEKMNTVGADYAGVVSAVGSNVKGHRIGDPVFGITEGDALPSHIKTEEDLALAIPKHMTFAEASTLPVVANTTYLCLAKTAKLEEGETILIHTASGGVGLCAVQLAQSLNCNIIATAGSARKRAYLKNLGVKHVFNSRNTNYETGIREVLEGKGVDVVLNSLTGPGFKEASLALCNQGARFIEMSKLNIWTKEDVKARRNDVFYEIVDLTTVPPSELKEYLKDIQNYLESSLIKPIPYVRFDVSDIREALSYMQKAKHIGKIVCIMPEAKPLKGKGQSLEKNIPMFNDRSTYIITGGLGGIGIEVAKWMAGSGATHIALVGRNPPNLKAAEEIQKLRANGVNVIVSQTDIGSFEQCQQLLDVLTSKVTSLPPVRGIMHAAGVIADATIENQSWNKFQAVFNAKVRGGWNLHKLTLNYHLEHFVMFSSGTVNLGAPGQSNHVAANAFLDSLASFRHSIGLPAASVNWGQWGQVGVAANMELAFLKPMTPLQGISALDIIMRKQRLQTLVAETDFKIIKKALPRTWKYFEELKERQVDKIEEALVNKEGFWKEYDAAENKEKQHEVVSKYIRSLIRQVLKLDENDSFDDDSNLQDMGMDSMMMIEMKNFLQSLVGDRAKITVNSVKDCNTVRKLGERIVQLVTGVEDIPIPTKEELRQLIREDAQLPLEIKPATGNYCKISEMQTVLVTGVTGNLGPYILREISKRPNILKVYCLMRPSAKLSIKERLHQIIIEKGLQSEIQLENIHCISGNIRLPNFGLSEETYSSLSKEIDGIFHLAVKPGILDFYRKDLPSDDSVRCVNVEGTKEVLKFACSNKTKYVFHASTTIAVSTLDKNERLSEEWPEIHDFDDFPNSAYPISKFVCDLLIADAVRRGIPCKAFRFPFIGGDSKTGKNVAVLNNHLLLRMMAYMKLGVMPAICIPFMIVPVDICADISCRLFFNDATGFEIYNVSNPYSNDEQELEDISEGFGYPVETIEPDEFFQKVDEAEDSELLVFLKKGVECHKEGWMWLQNDIPSPAKAWIINRKHVFVSEKLTRLIPEYPQCMESSLDILVRDLREAKHSGIFNKLGLSIK